MHGTPVVGLSDKRVTELRAQVGRALFGTREGRSRALEVLPGPEQLADPEYTAVLVSGEDSEITF
eukprot:4200927-Pyramimonas_sp.AAC.1